MTLTKSQIDRPIRVGLMSSRASRLGGGVSEAVKTLAISLRETGRIEPVIFTLNDDYLKDDIKEFDGIEILSFPQYGPKSFGYSPGLLRALLSSHIDILHLHGIWMFPSIVGWLWKKKHRRPYVISPHGMLDPWILNRNPLKKWLARTVYENRSLNAADVIHSLTQSETNSILDLFPGHKISQIPNGVDDSSIQSREGEPETKPYICFLGRLHTKKNIEELINAWSDVHEDVKATGYSLLVAGWGDPLYEEKINSLIQEVTKTASIKLVGPKFGKEKVAFLREAQFFILPSFSEGLPMTVLEAWKEGTPALITKNCNLPIGVERNSAIEIGAHRNELALGLREALHMEKHRWKTLSLNAQSLIVEEFSLRKIAIYWVKLYSSLI